MPDRAVLLVNLGTPASTSIPDVRRYLDEFLMDPRVIDYPGWARFLIVRGLILTFRPPKTAAKYRSIWTPEGSPLMVHSRALERALRSSLGSDAAVYLAMRYAQPSMPDVLRTMAADGVREVLLVPLYPHYAMSTWETVVARYHELVTSLNLPFATTTLQPFAADADYIEALWESARDHFASPHDHVLISFHGVPRRHLFRADSSRFHCQQVPDCCHTCSPAHATCYRAQCVATAEAFAARAGIPRDRWSISFQSRLGREVWLEPYTEDTLAALARSGVRRLLCITPAFVSDCIETLEEIRMEGREIFEHNGGEHFEHIPCLNSHPAWVRFLAGRARRWLSAPTVAPIAMTGAAAAAGAARAGHVG